MKYKGLQLRTTIFVFVAVANKSNEDFYGQFDCSVVSRLVIICTTFHIKSESNNTWEWLLLSQFMLGINASSKSRVDKLNNLALHTIER